MFYFRGVLSAIIRGESMRSFLSFTLWSFYLTFSPSFPLVPSNSILSPFCPLLVSFLSPSLLGSPLLLSVAASFLCHILSYFLSPEDTRSAVEKICQFLGKKLEPEELSSVVENSSFQVMKENNMSNFSLLKGLHLGDTGCLLRKGKENTRLSKSLRG